MDRALSSCALRTPSLPIGEIAPSLQACRHSGPTRYFKLWKCSCPNIPPWSFDHEAVSTVNCLLSTDYCSLRPSPAQPRGSPKDLPAGGEPDGGHLHRG